MENPLYWLYPVAPYVGAWIEIRWGTTHKGIDIVAPYVGAWIEITGALKTGWRTVAMSLT